MPFLCPCPWLEETEEQLGKACVRPHCRAGEVEAVGGGEEEDEREGMEDMGGGDGGGEEEDEEVQGHLGLTAFIHLAFWCSCGDCQVDNVNSSSKRWSSSSSKTSLLILLRPFPNIPLEFIKPTETENSVLSNRNDC